MGEKTIEQRIHAEQLRLRKVFRDLDANKMKVVSPLIDRAAFLAVHLQDLEEDLNKNGWTEEYTNGKDQSGIKRSAAADVHIALTKNLSTINKQLVELVPAEKKASKLAALQAGGFK